MDSLIRFLEVIPTLCVICGCIWGAGLIVAGVASCVEGCDSQKEGDFDF